MLFKGLTYRLSFISHNHSVRQVQSLSPFLKARTLKFRGPGQFPQVHIPSTWLGTILHLALCNSKGQYFLLVTTTEKSLAHAPGMESAPAGFLALESSEGKSKLLYLSKER